MHNGIENLLLVVIAAGVLGWIAWKFKQPIIPAFIVSGIMIGPIGLGLMHEPEAIARLSEIAIIFVLFIVGLEMDFRRVSSVGKAAVLGGFIQVSLLSFVGFVFSFLWFDFVTAVYLGFAFSFGSTMLVVKMLQDAGMLESMTGRIALGILLIQDIIAIIALSLIPLGSFSLKPILQTIISTSGFILLVVVVGGNYLFPFIFERIKRSEELLLLVSLAICFAVGWLCEFMGLSVSIGAFLSGVAMAGLPMRIELIARAKSLKDFFVPIFFVSVGVQLAIPGTEMIIPVIALTLVCLTLKPLLTAWIITFFRFPKKVSFDVGNFLTPISEFGLVIINLGIHTGHIKSEFLTLIIIVMTATMIASSYMTKVRVSRWIFNMVKPLAVLVPKAKILYGVMEPEDNGYEAVIVGCRNFGQAILDFILKEFKTVVVDINLDVYKTLKPKGIPVIIADAREPEIWREEHLGDPSKIKRIYCTITEEDFLEGSVPFFLERFPNACLIICSHDQKRTKELYARYKKYDKRLYIFCLATILSMRIMAGKMPHLVDDSLDAVRMKELEHLIRCVEVWDPESCNEIRCLLEPEISMAVAAN